MVSLGNYTGGCKKLVEVYLQLYMTCYITDCDSVVKQAIGKQQNYTMSCIGWVHRCMDWVQMNPHASPWRYHCIIIIMWSALY